MQIENTASAEILVVACVVGEKTVVTELDAEIFRAEVVFVLVTAEDRTDITALYTSREQTRIERVAGNVFQLMIGKTEGILVNRRQRMLGGWNVHVHQRRHFVSEICFQKLG